MNRIVIIAFAILLSLTGLFGYLSYEFHSEKAVAVGELRKANESLKTAQKAYETKDMSCKIDDTSVVEVEQEKKELQSKVENLNKRLDDLSKQASLIKKPTINKENTNVEKPNILYGSELLSPELIGMLSEAYCNVEPNDSSCPTKQPSN